MSKHPFILFWGLLTTSILTFACSDKEDLAIENHQEISYKTGNDLSATHTVTWARPWQEEEYLMLGYGYDATGKYAHPSAVRAKVIDLQNMDESSVSVNRSTSNGPTPLLAGSLSQFASALAANAKYSQEDIAKYKNLFRETFQDKFSADSTNFPNLEYNYAYVSQRIVMRTLLFDSYKLEQKSPEEKDTYISPQFKQDLLHSSAEDIIAKYGTHVLQQPVIGKRVDYLYRHSPYESHDAQYWFTSRVREYFSILPGVGVWPNNPDAASPAKENLYMEVVDNGTSKPNAWMIDVTNYAGARIKYDGFYGENNLEEATLIDISFGRGFPGIMPLHEFVSDPIKKKEIKTAIERYLSQ